MGAATATSPSAPEAPAPFYAVGDTHALAVLGTAHLSPEVRDIVYVSTVAPQQGGLGPEAPAPPEFVRRDQYTP